ncbi:MAG: YicC family protein [Spirochaetaceae bacterium]|jgi:uncharacterized protein (TIGR00255 family)|nr:YicC family protein [Spirochaetaceae bacterium]
MTGYGYQEERNEEMFLSAEIKGYNSRFLEMTVNLPAQISGLDYEIRRYMAERCRRGKIEITLHLKEYDTEFSVSLNRGAVTAYLKAIAELRKITQDFFLEKETSGLEKPLPEMIFEKDILTFLGLERVLEIEKTGNKTAYWDRLEPVLRSAADQFEADRIREGKHTETAILSYLRDIESSVNIVVAQIPILEISIKENLKARFIELQKDIDENRVLAETAVLLMKYSIAEEVSRVSAHLTEFRAEIGRNPSPGKKLDFLCQELNREINTIGSKTPVFEASRAVVAMKDALENIREQLRNIE